MRQAAIAGVGYTTFSKDSGQTPLGLAREACQAAIDDAGITARDVDGIASFAVLNDSAPCVAVASALAVPQLRFVVDADLGGQAPCYLTWLASMAVATGQAEHVLVFRALNGRSGARVGTMEFPGAGAPFRYPIGYDAYLMYCAMWGKRFLIETGQDELDLGAVAVAQRAYAERNERAVKRRPLTLEQHQAQSFVAEPFRPDDCTVEVDGACAILVTSVERARDLPHPPAVIASGAFRAGPKPGLDIGDHLLWDDYTRNYTSHLRDELFGKAGLTPADVTLAEIYDCFSSTVLMGIEGLGLADRGESGEWVRKAEVPLNTHGGLLSEGYLHGMNTVAEAALQVMGRGGDRQAPNVDVVAVTSGALMDGSAMLLTPDR
ncbi:MAG: Acetyl-CoA acetyltransferase [Actinomycetia bacterium]|nr:Acetyl-CoA acetyltransferase [Actinomycetes bacterium]